MIEKPPDMFDRLDEWADLVGFVDDRSAGLRIGVVRGRRRHGKSFLLEHLCHAVGGSYTLALRQSRAMALEQVRAAAAAGQVRLVDLATLYGR